MQKVLADLIELLALERLDRDLFRGRSQDLGGRHLWRAGLGAGAFCRDADGSTRATRALPPRNFLRAGELDKAIVYQVERLRDGKSFATRRVSAIQEGEAILQFGSFVSSA